MSSFVIKFDESPFIKKHDISVCSVKSFKKEINKLLNATEGSAILQRDNDDFLFFGVEGDLGFVQYDPGSKDGEYLWVKNLNLEKSDEIISFNIGGTETEIYRHRCVDKSTLLKTALYFFEYGKLIDADWEIDDV